MERDVNRMLLRNKETCHSICRLVSLRIDIYRGDRQDVVLQLLNLADASADDSASNSYDTAAVTCKMILQQRGKLITTPVGRFHTVLSLSMELFNWLGRSLPSSQHITARPLKDSNQPRIRQNGGEGTETRYIRSRIKDCATHSIDRRQSFSSMNRTAESI